MNDTKERLLLMALRQALITFLCALEDYLDIERSVMSRKERRRILNGTHDTIPMR